MTTQAIKPLICLIDDNYKGMTVDERFWFSGLFGEFDKAVKERDVKKIVRILERLELTQRNIDTILKSYGLEDHSTRLPTPLH